MSYGFSGSFAEEFCAKAKPLGAEIYPALHMSAVHHNNDTIHLKQLLTICQLGQ
jgi:hypothetical protein